MKKFLSGLLVGIIFATMTTAFAADQIAAYFNPDVKINIDGSPLTTVIVSITETQKNYASVRDVAEALGATVTWNQDTKAIDITSNITSNESEVSTMDNTIVTTQIDILGLAYIENNGIKYVNAVDLVKFCESQGFTFSVGGLMDATTKYALLKSKSYEGMQGTIEVYTIDKLPYFKYDFVVNTLVPFMEDSK